MSQIRYSLDILDMSKRELSSESDVGQGETPIFASLANYKFQIISTQKFNNIIKNYLNKKKILTSLQIKNL